MPKITWIDRVQYWFDNYMARGTRALIGGLAILSLILIFIVASAVSLLRIAPGDGEPIGFFEAFWLSLMRTLDAGTMGGDIGWPFRIAMFVVTLGGVFVISSLIGVLTSGLEGKLDQMRKGRSRVIETGHTVILGWSPQIFIIVSELVEANANTKGCIVILSEKDKVEMEEALESALPNGPRTTRIVCRSGSPISLTDLEIVSPQTSKSIIILSPEGKTQDADATVIKTILAIANSANRRTEPYHIVAEIHDPKNASVAKLVGKTELELVLVGDLIARIIAQTCRQSGLSIVYNELLDFEGDDIYFKQEPALTGQTYGQALFLYEDSSLIGLRKKGVGVRLNPPMDTPIEAEDEVIVISEDDDTIRLSGKNIQEPTLAVFEPAVIPAAAPESTIILGWNWRAPKIALELDHYVAPGSRVVVVADAADHEKEVRHCCRRLVNQKAEFISADTTDREVLDELHLEQYQHVILLCYSDELEPQQADARTLVTLLQLRDIAEQSGRKFSIVSEMMDIRNRDLAEVAHPDDFIVSDRLTSLMLAQISENKEINAVFEDLFNPEGSEIYLKPAEQYVPLGQAVDFYTVLAAAKRRGETAFGYCSKATDQPHQLANGLVVNPDKSVKVTFQAGDRIVVLAEN